jgi:hypothetical protein
MATCVEEQAHYMLAAGIQYAASVEEATVPRLLSRVMAVRAARAKPQSSSPPAPSATTREVMTPDGPPPEQPETYNEIVRCLAARGAFDIPMTQQNAAQEECEETASGITLNEYLAMSIGCIMSIDETAQPTCISGVDKLRPMFTPGAKEAAVAPRDLRIAELIAMESVCSHIHDDLTNKRCLVGIRKLKEQILQKSQ